MSEPKPLIPVDAPEEELPQLELSGKGIRRWLADNHPGEVMPAAFEDLVSLATHEKAKPFINHGGTWPSIIRNRLPFACANGYHEAADRLITSALLNTNATADHGTWLELFKQRSEIETKAWTNAFLALLPSLLRSTRHAGMNLIKNMQPLMEAENSWFSADLIRDWPDEKVVGMATSEGSYTNVSTAILKAWLNDETMHDDRFSLWQAKYIERKTLAPKGALTILEIMAGVFEPGRLELPRRVFDVCSSEESAHLLSKLSATRPDLMNDTQFLALLYESICKTPFHLPIAGSAGKAGFHKQHIERAWERLTQQTRARLALLTVCYFRYSKEWCTWFDGVREELNLPANAWELLDSVGIHEWPDAVRMMGEHIKPSALPELSM